MDLLEGSTLFQDRRFEEDPVLKALYVLLMTHEGDEIKPPSREILMPAQATVSIGANYELSGLMPEESLANNLRDVIYNQVGFASFKLKKGEERNINSEFDYLAFAVGKFSPRIGPHERDETVYMAEFDDYSTFFAVVISQTQFKAFTENETIPLPTDGWALWVDGGNVYRNINEVVARRRNGFVSHEELFDRDNIESSIVVGDGQGKYYHLPRNHKQRRGLNLELGLSPLTLEKLDYAGNSEMDLAAAMFEDLMGERRFLNPAPFDEVAHSVDIGLGPKGYGSESIVARTAGAPSSTKKSQRLTT